MRYKKSNCDENIQTNRDGNLLDIAEVKQNQNPEAILRKNIDFKNKEKIEEKKPPLLTKRNTTTKSRHKSKGSNQSLNQFELSRESNQNAQNNSKIKTNSSKNHLKQSSNLDEKELAEICQDSINLNDEDYNNIIIKQSIDGSLAHLDINHNNITLDFQNDLITPTFVKREDRIINYEYLIEKDSKELNTNLQKNDHNISYKKESENRIININNSFEYSSLKCKQNEAESEEEAGNPTPINLNKLQELEDQISILKESLNELRVVHEITEMTSNVLIKQEEMEDRITLSLLNNERNPNCNIYSEITDQLHKAKSDLPRILK